MRSGLPDAAARTLFAGLLASVADEMLEALVRTAFSPNIKERRDASTAVFDGRGRLVAQAAAIPVHLGAMPLSVEAALAAFETWRAGDVVALNDRVAVSGGFGVGFDYGSGDEVYGGRVGLQWTR